MSAKGLGALGVGVACGTDMPFSSAGFEFITTGQFVVGGEGEEEGKGSTADAAAAAGGADSALLANGEINFDAI